MSKNRQKTSWIIDAVLFGGFLVALWLDLTGVGLHQWLGVTIGALAGWHLLAHGDWVKAVTARFFGRTSSQARLYYIVDAAMLAGLTTIVVTGLVISTWANLGLTSYAAWHRVHVWASVLTLAVLVAKVGLHWRWIVGVARRQVFRLPVLPAGPATNLAPVPVKVDRRDFIRLMGVVGVAALFTGARALDGQTVAADATAAEETAAAQPATAVAGATIPGRRDRTRGGPPQATTTTTTVAGSCTVQCGRRCSYPGHCRRYVDSNGNSRCDLGECLS